MNINDFSALEKTTNDKLYEKSSDNPIFFGLPHTKQYPMPDKKHVKSAIRFFNYVSGEDEAELAKNINNRIKYFDMADDINVGDGNRFKKYFKPATESSKPSKNELRESGKERAAQIFAISKKEAFKTVQSLCGDSGMKIDDFHFYKSWDSQPFDIDEDLKRGFINMCLFDVEIHRGRAINKRNPNAGIKSFLSKVTKILNKSKAIHHVAESYRVGFRKLGEYKYVYCIEWSYVDHNKKEDKFNSPISKIKRINREIKSELKQDRPDIDDPKAGRTTNLLGDEEDGGGRSYDYKNGDESVILNTAPIVPYQGALQKESIKSRKYRRF